MEIKYFVEAILSLRAGIKHHIQKRIREDHIDLTYEMLQVLGTLWASGEMNQQEIANRVQKNKASLTPLLDNLAKRGLVTRTADPADRRNKIISLTQQGKEQEHQAYKLWEELYASLALRLDAAALHSATETLKIMKENIFL
ncbi:MarR family winged helix-turn-helix transcriptional regulator [Pedobacter sp.]|uniref:MarR family winged helix-turn-helix transcriptional regulator n=1 Tax=Pedobacter sp. TaxID=1411316 RepID=UPI003C4883E2